MERVCGGRYLRAAPLRSCGSRVDEHCDLLCILSEVQSTIHAHPRIIRGTLVLIVLRDLNSDTNREAFTAGYALPENARSLGIHFVGSGTPGREPQQASPGRRESDASEVRDHPLARARCGRLTTVRAALWAEETGLLDGGPAHSRVDRIHERGKSFQSVRRWILDRDVDAMHPRSEFG